MIFILLKDGQARSFQRYKDEGIDVYTYVCRLCFSSLLQRPAAFLQQPIPTVVVSWSESSHGASPGLLLLEGRAAEDGAQPLPRCRARGQREVSQWETDCILGQKNLLPMGWPKARTEGAMSPSLERGEGAEQPGPASLASMERSDQTSQGSCPRWAILRVLSGCFVFIQTVNEPIFTSKVSHLHRTKISSRDLQLPLRATCVTTS